MPRYAMVAVVEAPGAEIAWEGVCRRLLTDEAARSSTAYVGAPWLVPFDSMDEPVDYETDEIRLRLNGEEISLDPAD